MAFIYRGLSFVLGLHLSSIRRQFVVNSSDVNSFVVNKQSTTPTGEK